MDFNSRAEHMKQFKATGLEAEADAAKDKNKKFVDIGEVKRKAPRTGVTLNFGSEWAQAGVDQYEG